MQSDFDLDPDRSLETDALIDFDMLQGYLGFALHRALLILRRDFVATLASAELRPIAFNVLVLVGANPGMAQARLASALSLDKGTLANLLKDFQQRGWIESTVRSDDRRSKGVFLSPAGVRALLPLKAEVLAHLRRVGRIFSPEEQKRLAELLQRIVL